MFNLLTPYAIDVFEPIAKWLVIGATSVILISWLIALLTKKDALLPLIKTTVAALFIFLLAVGLTCLIMEIAKSYSLSYAEENWLDRQALLKYVLIPLCVLIVLLIASTIAIIVALKKSNSENKDKNVKKTLAICGIIDLIALITCGILLAVYYNAKFVDDGYYNSDTASVNQPVLYISAALLVITLIALAFILDKDKKPLDTHCISMAGITVAMSFGLSYVKLFEMPQGGSITLFSLLPIMIFSCIYGTKKGVFVCLIYGILQAVQDPWIIHPAQFLLDYPVAFAAIGLTGLMTNVKAFNDKPQVSFLLGGIIASVLRFLSHVLSGVFAFAAYADGANPWVYSLGYNSFVFVDIAIVLVVGFIVFSSKAFVKEMQKFSVK